MAEVWVCFDVDEKLMLETTEIQVCFNFVEGLMLEISEIQVCFDDESNELTHQHSNGAACSFSWCSNWDFSSMRTVGSFKQSLINKDCFN